MKFPLFTISIILAYACQGQDSTAIKNIDTTVAQTVTYLRQKVFKTIQFDTVLNSRSNTIRISYEDKEIKAMVQEDEGRINVTMYILNHNNVIYLLAFSNGDLNIPTSTIYFVKGESYLKEGTKFKKLEPSHYYFEMINSYVQTFRNRL